MGLADAGLSRRDPLGAHATFREMFEVYQETSMATVRGGNGLADLTRFSNRKGSNANKNNYSVIEPIEEAVGKLAERQ